MSGAVNDRTMKMKMKMNMKSEKEECLGMEACSKKCENTRTHMREERKKGECNDTIHKHM